MSKYRNTLPQLSAGLFLTDGGVETDLIFNQGIEIREFAAHTLLYDSRGRASLTAYFRKFLQLARDSDAGFILDSQTWKAHMRWADALKSSEAELRKANIESISFIAGLRDEFAENRQPVVLSAVIGPCGDAYAPEKTIGPDEAEEYHSRQIGWLAETEVDMVTATTFNQEGEAIGFVRAARAVGFPVVVSFTVETDGCLPSGRSLRDAIESVDAATGSAPSYFMVNCAHPDHFFNKLSDESWTRRIRAIRCNASRLSHRELDACATLDAGDPEDLARQYKMLSQRMPWINVFGGCCGTDFRHIARIAAALGN